MYDVIIIGGGPAGLSAAIWCGELGLKYCLIERSSELGGQLGLIHLPIKNYPGIPSISSAELLKNLVGSLHGDSSVRLGADVSDIRLDPLSLSIGDEERIETRSIIIATGVRRRELGVPGEREFKDKGILASGAENPEAVAGQEVVIVGGGDAALENAVILSPHAAKVHVVHRGSGFSARPEFLETAKGLINVKFLTESIVEEFTGENELAAVRVRNVSSGDVTSVPVTRALVRIGVVPNSELFRNFISTDSKGYIQTDSNCRTNLAGVFAIGDVACPVSPTIVTATGMGATAAKTIACSPAFRRSLEFRL